MTDDGVVFHPVDADHVKPVEAVVLATRRNGRALHALELHAQHVDDINFLDDLIEARGLWAAEPVGVIHLEGRRPHERDLGTHGSKSRGQ